METQIYTLHRHRRSGALEVVGEAGWLAVIPPLWALWEGLWLTLAAQLLFLALMALYVPVAAGTGYVLLVILTVTEGAALHRAELALRGWREIALAEASTQEGAEEMLLTGRAVTEP